MYVYELNSQTNINLNMQMYIFILETIYLFIHETLICRQRVVTIKLHDLQVLANCV